MKRNLFRLTVTGGLLVAVVAAVHAQVLSGGVPPIENAGLAGARSPGQMVTASFSRLQEVIRGPIPNWDNITEGDTTPEIPTPYRAQASLILAQQLVIAIDLIVDAWLVRSGIVEAGTSNNGGRDTGGGRTPGRKAQVPAR